MDWPAIVLSLQLAAATVALLLPAGLALARVLAWRRFAGRRVLDAGCGTGQMAVLLARRGARVTAVDLSRSLIDVARARLPADLGAGAVAFHAGDMLDPALGTFDHVVAMDSLIHYRALDVARVLGALAPRTRGSIAFTFAPRTAALATLHAVGRLFPRGDRAPAIEPVAEDRLRALLAAEPGLAGRTAGRTQRIRSGFYQSQAFEVTAPCAG